MALAGCATSGPGAPQVVAARPPRDVGKPSQGGAEGDVHSSALEELAIGEIKKRSDKQKSVLVPLPDGANWTQVRFQLVKSLVGFRYGKEQHAIVGGIVTHADTKEPGACARTFEAWAAPWIELFEVDITHGKPDAVVWNGQIADIDTMDAKVATLTRRDTYAVAYGSYPAWPGACLILGVAVPAGGDMPRARKVRDRFVKDVLPFVEITSPTEPTGSF